MSEVYSYQKFLGLQCTRWHDLNGNEFKERAVSDESLSVLKRRGLVRVCEKKEKRKFGMVGFRIWLLTAAGKKLATKAEVA